jgi:hypothetical protein
MAERAVRRRRRLGIAAMSWSLGDMGDGVGWCRRIYGVRSAIAAATSLKTTTGRSSSPIDITRGAPTRFVACVRVCRCLCLRLLACDEGGS